MREVKNWTKLKVQVLTAVYWRDADAMDGWSSTDAIASAEVPTFITYGLLMRIDDNVVVVAGTAPVKDTETPDMRRFNDVSVIPAECVERIEQ